jgi:hypothetical protein
MQVGSFLHGRFGSFQAVIWWFYTPGVLPCQHYIRRAFPEQFRHKLKAADLTSNHPGVLPSFSSYG